MPATSTIGGLVGVTSTNFDCAAVVNVRMERIKNTKERTNTRHVLTCPFHSLAYEIECHQRAGMVEQLVHPILKRGHSNWLEASHNVFIHLRPKHIFLERLHYVLSTELVLLQSNMLAVITKSKKCKTLPDLDFLLGGDLPQVRVRWLRICLFVWVSSVCHH